MQINNVNNQTNFGISHVGVTSPYKRFTELVKGAEAEIKAIGNSEPICEIFDQELHDKKIGQVCVAVITGGANGSTIGGWVIKVIPRTKEALLELVEEANAKMNQKFFDLYHAQITAKPEIDSVTGRPKLSVVK